VDELGTWLTINEASKLTGWLPDKLRSDRRRGRLRGRKNNTGEWLVLIPPEAVARPDGPLGHPNGHAAGHAGSHATAEPAAWLLEELAELRERCGRAEGLAESRAEHIAGMAESLAKAEARADRLEAALAEARKPLLVRLVEALRRR
jgi:hypothetical protein